jgi:hypothetical protein
MMDMFKNANSSARLGENDFYKITSYILNNIGDLTVGEAKNYVQLSYRLKSHLSLLELSKELNDLTKRKLFPNQVILNQMIQQLFGMRKMTLAFELYDLARIKGIMDAYIYQSLIIGIAKSDRPNLDKVRQFYECAKQDGQLNPYIITSVFDALLKAQNVNYEQLMSIFQDVKTLNLENSYVYTKFLTALIQSEFVPDGHFFESIYAEMHEKKCINVHTLKVFLALYAKANVQNSEFIFEVYQQYKNVVLSSQILYGLIWKSLICAPQKNTSNLYVLFDDYSNRFTTYAPFCLELIDLFFTQGAASCEHIIDVYQKAEYLQLVNEDMYSKLMRAFLLTPLEHYQTVYQFYSKAVTIGKFDSSFFENMLRFVIQSKMASYPFFKQILKDMEHLQPKASQIFMLLLEFLIACDPFPWVDMIEIVELSKFSSEVFHYALANISGHITEKNFDALLFKRTVELYLHASSKGLVQEQDNSQLLNLLAMSPNRNPDIAWPLINKLTPVIVYQQIKGVYHVDLKSLKPGQVYFSLKRFFVEFLQGFHDEHKFEILTSNQLQAEMISRVFSELSYKFNNIQAMDSKVILISKSTYLHKDGFFSSQSGSAFKPYESKKNVSRETIQFGNS